jgi:N-acetyl-anhydromuramyl-L-alanine amidase AmpD
MSKEIQSTNFIVIHCSATRPDAQVTEETVRQWHLARNWSDIGYHVFIRRCGMIEYGRPLDVKGAHVLGHNHDSVGICLAGGLSTEGLPENNFTDDQWMSLERVVKAFRYLFPSAKVLGHRDFSGVSKACPCFDVREWMVGYLKDECNEVKK